LTGDQHEHLTKVYYDHADEFRILNLETRDASYAKLNFVVDTMEDLHRVEEMESKTRYDFVPDFEVTSS